MTGPATLELELARERRRRIRAEVLLLVMVAASMLGGGGAVWGVGHYQQLAAVHDSIADLREGEALALRERNGRLVAELRADSIELADSISRWAAQRRADSVAIVRLSARADELAATIDEHLDAATSALFASYRAQRDSIDATLRRDLRLETQRADRWEARASSLTELLDGRDAELELERSVNESLRSSIAARDDVIGAQGRENRLLKLAGAALIGLAVYDRVSGGAP